MTTMKLGVTRHGPFAPDAFQLGKYDTFTRTGAPGRSTSNEMPSSSVRMLVTRVSWTGRRSGASTVTPAPTVASTDGARRIRTRGQLLGPDCARGTDQRDSS